MDIWEIELSQEDIDEIIDATKKRQNTNRGAKNPDGAIIASYDADFQGSVGEYCHSKITSRPWTSKIFPFEQWLKVKNIIADSDETEIKCTCRSSRKARLWLRKYQTNHPDRKYVLYRGYNLPEKDAELWTYKPGDPIPRVKAIGWAYGREIAQEHNYEEGRHGAPCYYIEDYDLHPMNEFFDLIEKESL